MSTTFNNAEDQTANQNSSEDQSGNNLEDRNDQGSQFANANSADQQNNAGKNDLEMTKGDLSALIKKSEHAQDYIKKLEQENEDSRKLVTLMEEKLSQSANVEELLKKGENESLSNDDLVSQVTNQVNNQMAQQRTKDTADSNFQLVSDALSATYGEKTDERVKQVCQENDMTWDQMVGLSRTNPKLVLGLCKAEQSKGEAPASSGGVNTQGFQGQNNQQTESLGKGYVNIRSDKQRVEVFNQYMEQKLKELGY